MNISSLFIGIKKPSRKRVARGIAGSGGKTAGRGTKGQNARGGSGRKVQEWFEGGQTPLYRIQAKKRGFRSRRPIVKTITTTTLAHFYKDGDTVSPQTLLDHKIIRKSELPYPIKIVKRTDNFPKLKFDSVRLSKSIES